MTKFLKPTNAFIWRIVHKDNVGWILKNGIHCANSPTQDPDYIPIGNGSLIEERKTWPVNHPPGGHLSDYVPFYFTPYSPMLLNIITGRNGVVMRPKSDICILVASLYKLKEAGIPFIFTDRHAKLAKATMSDDLGDLGMIDWSALQAKNFRRDPDNPEAFEKYQAEALVHKHLPVANLEAIVTYNAAVKKPLHEAVESDGLSVKVAVKPEFYF